MEHNNDFTLLVTGSRNRELVGQLQIRHSILNCRHIEGNRGLTSRNRYLLWIGKAFAVLAVQLHHNITLRSFVDRYRQLEGIALVDIGLRSCQFQGWQLIVLDNNAGCHLVVAIATNRNTGNRVGIEHGVVLYLGIEHNTRLIGRNGDT